VGFQVRGGTSKLWNQKTKCIAHHEFDELVRILAFATGLGKFCDSEPAATLSNWAARLAYSTIPDNALRLRNCIEGVFKITLRLEVQQCLNFAGEPIAEVSCESVP
jgi:hypothetical protein